MCFVSPTPPSQEQSLSFVPDATCAVAVRRNQMRLAIELAVTRVFGVELEALGQVSRGVARIALARQVAMYIAHVGCGLTMRQAGELFGRDRTTVAHACLTVENRRDDPMFDRALDLLEWAVPVMVLRPANYFQNQ